MNIIVSEEIILRKLRRISRAFASCQWAFREVMDGWMDGWINKGLNNPVSAW